MPGILERWFPVTHDYGLIRAPAAAVVAAYMEWQRSIDIELARVDITGSLADALAMLAPLTASKTKRLFVATRSAWTVFYQNGIQGSDPFPPMSYLASRMRVLAMRVCSTPPGSPYAATIWEVYAPPELGGSTPLGVRRSIVAANDGGRWIFDESGERYPFEKAQHYSAARKRDRFTAEMLRDYLVNFEIDPWNDDYLQVGPETPAIFLERRMPIAVTPEYTLQEVVAGVPWRRKT